MNTKTHDEIELLLPFYINGTLSDEEKAMVEAALQANPALKEELQFLQNLQSQLKDKTDDEHSPGKMGLKRLQKTIKQQQKGNAARRWRYTAIAASLLLAAQTSLIVLTSGPDIYTQAGSQQPAGLIMVTFAPDTTESQLREFLLNNHLLIVEGPSALGIYKLTAQGDLSLTLKNLNQATIVESAQVSQ